MEEPGVHDRVCPGILDLDLVGPANAVLMTRAPDTSTGRVHQAHPRPAYGWAGTPAGGESRVDGSGPSSSARRLSGAAGGGTAVPDEGRAGGPGQGGTRAGLRGDKILHCGPERAPCTGEAR